MTHATTADYDTATALAYALPTIGESLDSIAHDTANVLAYHGLSLPVNVISQAHGAYYALRLHVTDADMAAMEDKATHLLVGAAWLHVTMALRCLYLTREYLESAHISRETMAQHAEQAASISALQGIDNIRKNRETEPAAPTRTTPTTRRKRKRWQPGMLTITAAIVAPLTLGLLLIVDMLG